MEEKLENIKRIAEEIRLKQEQLEQEISDLIGTRPNDR